jgi:hypothetical protein
MSTKKYVSVLAGAAVVVAAVVFGILGCEQNATHEAAVKPAAGQHMRASPTPPKPKPAGRHTEGPTITPPPSQ